jgi:hypothetical protein
MFRASNVSASAPARAFAACAGYSTAMFVRRNQRGGETGSPDSAGRAATAFAMSA